MSNPSPFISHISQLKALAESHEGLGYMRIDGAAPQPAEPLGHCRLADACAVTGQLQLQRQLAAGLLLACYCYTQ